MKFFFNFFLIFLLLFYKIHAQQPAMWQITDEDGLPSLTVYDIFQDERGFIWLGTEMGMYQFDGKSYKHIQPKNARGRAMSYIQADNEGNVWFANFSGQLFRWKNDTITEADFVKKVGANNNFVYVIEDDNIWFIWEHLYQYNLKTKKLINFSEKYKDLKNDNFGYFVTVEIDPYRKGIWALINTNSTQHQFYQLFFIQNGKIKSQTSVPINFKNHISLNVTSKDLIIFDRGNNKVYKKNLENTDTENTDKDFQLFFDGNQNDNKQILFGRYDETGNFWICTFSGTFCFDKNLNPIHNKLCILPKKTVSDILVDREGNMWISTLKDGIFVLPNKDVLHFNTSNTNILENTINCVASDDEENLFLGLNNGKVAYFDTKKQQVLHYYDTHHQKDIETIYYDTKHKKIYVGCAFTYIFDKGNFEPIYQRIGISPKSYTIFQNTLISANANEANAVSIENNTFGEGLPLKSFFKNNKIFKKNEKSDTTYYEGGANNTNFFLKPTKVSVLEEIKNLLHFRQVRSRAIWAEHHRFWVAYSDGLFVYENGKEKQLLTAENKPILVRCFTQTQDSTLWIGTIEQGFFKVFEGKIQAQYTTQNLPGLSSNFIRCIGTDAKHLWLSTDKGIVYFEPKTLRTRIYDRQDGIMSNEITSITFKNQQLWLTSTKGIFRLPTRQLPYNTNPPPIYITGVKIWENEVPLIGEYVLRHTENNLKIEFQALAYRSRGIFKYKYRMIGVDSTWIYTESTNNFARYPSANVDTTLHRKCLKTRTSAQKN